jgi:hypothetical protein
VVHLPPANSPLILNEVRSLALDSQGNLWLTNVSVQSTAARYTGSIPSNVWTQYRVGEELPWTPPWYINAVLVGATILLADALGLGGMAEFNGAGVLHTSVSDGRMFADSRAASGSGPHSSDRQMEPRLSRQWSATP